MSDLKLMNFRASPVEIERWRDEAWAQRLSLSAWIRRRLNGVEMVPPAAGPVRLASRKQLRQTGSIVVRRLPKGSKRI
jgi:hypothetical protein